MNVHVVVPGLFPDPARADAMLAPTRVDALELLAARGRRRSAGAAGLEAWFLEAFGVARQTDWPAAPYSLLGDDGEPDGACWLRADPVALQAVHDTVLVADASLLDIGREEAAALAASLNEHFAGQGIVFHPVRPGRWYARVGENPEMTAAPLADVPGAALMDHLPQGPRGRHWRAIFTEIQMRLHDHPVNRGREARGALPLNGVWLWGAGRAAERVRARYRRVTADDPVARGLARAAGTRSDPLPATAGDWLGQSDRAGVEAIVLDALRAPAARGDSATWQSVLQRLEQDWFAPLLAALRAGRIGMITLVAPGPLQTQEFETTRQDLRFFWRRRRRLAEYAA